MNIDPIPMDFSPDPGPGPTPAPARHLSGRQKAAIVVRLLAREGLAPPLHDLPEDVQADLIRQIGTSGDPDAADVAAVAEEFASLMETGTAFGPAAIAKALDLLDGAISPTVAQRLRAQAAEGGDPWERIAEKNAESLLPVFETESIEVAAIILSKLPVATAAAVLGLLPGDRARRITFAVSLTSAVAPDAVRRIGRALATVLDVEPVTAFADGPVVRVGAILNSSRNATRNDVLEGLDEADKSFAEEVRRAIFTFANIRQRIAPRDIPKILRGVEQDVVVRALAGATGDLAPVAEFIMTALPQRMADAIRGEVEELGEVDEEVSDEAMGEIIAVIRQLEADGEIHLVAEEG